MWFDARALAEVNCTCRNGVYQDEEVLLNG